MSWWSRGDMSAMRPCTGCGTAKVAGVVCPGSGGTTRGAGTTGACHLTWDSPMVMIGSTRFESFGSSGKVEGIGTRTKVDAGLNSGIEAGRKSSICGTTDDACF
mmetsp:Transcript_87139/g.281430  ORF Transcript_87139/g.281430 Transcript_87139/m.281430 type:complete len:104 (-) Transcript_87139:1394-1705(-)